jgi:hypothetical protein
VADKSSFLIPLRDVRHFFGVGAVVPPFDHVLRMSAVVVSLLQTKIGSIQNFGRQQAPQLIGGGCFKVLDVLRRTPGAGVAKAARCRLFR